MKEILTRRCFWGSAVFALAATIHTAVGSEPAALKKVLSDKSSTIVTIKFVLKVTMPEMLGGENEQETEINGTLIDPKGVALCANSQLGGFVGMMKRMMGSLGEEMSATPTELKILVGEDTEGRDAELVARDSELDLAWVRIKEPGEKPFEFVDLQKAAKPEVGDSVLAVRRLGKYFARMPVVMETRIGGVTSKPRTLYVPTQGGGGLGLPVFTPAGELLGVTVSQIPESDESAGNPLMMMGRMSEFQESMGGMILPAGEVARATTRAMENAEKEKK